MIGLLQEASGEVYMTPSVRSRLINAAAELLQRRGAAGTSVSELIERSCTARRSIYQHFPGGKGQLLAAAVDDAGGKLSTLIEQMVAARRPAEALNTFIGFWKQLLTSTEFTAGCPIAAAAYGGHDAPEARDKAAAVFNRWRDILQTQLIANGAEEDQARSTATVIIAAIEGAVVMSLAERSTAALDQVHTQLSSLLPLLPEAVE